jgi:hypothetical protein
VRQQLGGLHQQISQQLHARQMLLQMLLQQQGLMQRLVLNQQQK